MELSYMEMLQKITDSVYDSVVKMVKKLSYDRTFRAKVIGQISGGKYQVLYKNNTYTISCDGVLSPDQLVWVHVPENNWDALYVEAAVPESDGPTAAGKVTGVKGASEELYRTGTVNITPENIGLGNVDNTADSNKEVKSAQKLKKACTINGVPFDGTENIRVTEEVVRLTKTEYDAMQKAGTLDENTYYLIMDDETEMGLPIATAETAGIIKGSNDILISDDGAATIDTNYDTVAADTRTNISNITKGGSFKTILGNIVAALSGLVTLGEMRALLVNNGLTTEAGKYFLDAAFGKTLLDQINSQNANISNKNSILTVDGHTISFSWSASRIYIDSTAVGKLGGYPIEANMSDGGGRLGTMGFDSGLYIYIDGNKHHIQITD